MIDQLEPAEWHWWTGDAFGWITYAPEERPREETMDQYQWDQDRSWDGLAEWHYYPQTPTGKGCAGCVLANGNGTWDVKMQYHHVHLVVDDPEAGKTIVEAIVAGARR